MYRKVPTAWHDWICPSKGSRANQRAKLEIWKNPESTSKINFASIWRLDFDAIIPQSEKMVPTASSILRLKRTSFCVIGSGKLTQMTRSCQSGTVTCKLTPMSDTEVRTRCSNWSASHKNRIRTNTAAPGILPHAGTSNANHYSRKKMIRWLSSDNSCKCWTDQESKTSRLHCSTASLHLKALQPLNFCRACIISRRQAAESEVLQGQTYQASSEEKTGKSTAKTIQHWLVSTTQIWMRAFKVLNGKLDARQSFGCVSCKCVSAAWSLLLVEGQAAFKLSNCIIASKEWNSEIHISPSSRVHRGRMLCKYLQ